MAKHVRSSTVRRLLTRGFASAGQFLAALRQERSELVAPPDGAVSVFDRAAGLIPPREGSSGAVFDAPKRLSMAREYFTTITHMDQHKRADWSYVDPLLGRWYAAFYKRLRSLGIPVFCLCAYRTPADQIEMVRKGVSKAGVKSAYHPRGLALDIIHSVHGYELSDAEWRLLGKVGFDVARTLGIELEWGGDWGADWERGKRGWDPAHWQLAVTTLDGIPAQYPRPDHVKLYRTPAVLARLHR